MHRRLRVDVILLLAAVVVTWTAGPAAAQPSISGLAGRNAPLSEQDKRDVTAWVTHWASALASEDADLSRLAKRRLLEPVNEPVVRPIFRDEYGRIIVAELTRLLNGESVFAAVNAVQVMGGVGSDGCLAAVRERLDPQSEPREAVRIWAVQSVAQIRKIGVATPRNLDAAMRDVMRAAERETSWIVLRRQFEMIAEADTPQSLDFQIDLLKIFLDKVEAEDDASPVMQAVHRALHLLLNQWVQMSLNDQRRFGTALAPQLGRVFDIGVKQWEAVRQAREQVKAAYNSAVGLSEQLLGFIDEQVRGRTTTPPQSIQRAWGNGNRTGFEQAISHWQTVLRQPPYAAR